MIVKFPKFEMMYPYPIFDLKYKIRGLQINENQRVYFLPTGIQVTDKEFELIKDYPLLW